MSTREEQITTLAQFVAKLTNNRLTTEQVTDIIKAADHEDIIMWPDGSWCYREQLSEYNYMSDDYRIIPFDSIEWNAVNSDNHAEYRP